MALHVCRIANAGDVRVFLVSSSRAKLSKFTQSCDSPKSTCTSQATSSFDQDQDTMTGTPTAAAMHYAAATVPLITVDSKGRKRPPKAPQAYACHSYAPQPHCASTPTGAQSTAYGDLRRGSSSASAAPLRCRELSACHAVGNRAEEQRVRRAGGTCSQRGVQVFQADGYLRVTRSIGGACSVHGRSPSSHRQPRLLQTRRFTCWEQL